MKVTIDLQLAIRKSLEKMYIPSLEQIQKWTQTALEFASFDNDFAEITVRIVDESEICQLNNEYRHKNRPTNILSFPFEAPPQIPCDLLGDLVICQSVVEKEANEQQKKQVSHWAHMIVHGTLHLIGFDHIEPEDATIMEKMEISILNNLGFSDPYQI